MNLFNIAKSFKVMEKRGWDKVFWMVDIHETILKPNWDADNIPHEWYPYAKEVLQEISQRNDICLILYTCSYEPEIESYLKFFKESGIHFQHVNKNPEAINTRYGRFDEKPYFNVLLDDKCGFEGELDSDGINDWYRIKEELKKFPVKSTILDVEN